MPHCLIAWIMTGCAWLTSEIPPDAVLTPEQLGDEHRLIAQTAAAFVANEVVPARAAPRTEETGPSRGS